MERAAQDRDDWTLLRVATPDRPGGLAVFARCMAACGVDILSIEILGHEGPKAVARRARARRRPRPGAARARRGPRPARAAARTAISPIRRWRWRRRAGWCSPTARRRLLLDAAMRLVGADLGAVYLVGGRRAGRGPPRPTARPGVARAGALRRAGPRSRSRPRARRSRSRSATGRRAGAGGGPRPDVPVPGGGGRPPASAGRAGPAGAGGVVVLRSATRVPADGPWPRLRDAGREATDEDDADDQPRGPPAARPRPPLLLPAVRRRGGSVIDVVRDAPHLPAAVHAAPGVKAVPVRAHRFAPGGEYPLGVEEELMLVDAGDLRAARRRRAAPARRSTTTASSPS